MSIRDAAAKISRDWDRLPSGGRRVGWRGNTSVVTCMIPVHGISQFYSIHQAENLRLQTHVLSNLDC